MITRLKKHNDSLFLILLLILLSGGSWFFNHNMSGKVYFLEGEVKKIEKQGNGRMIYVTDESVGRSIFSKVSESGYTQAFVQAPPTLDEIFRKEVAENV